MDGSRLLGGRDGGGGERGHRAETTSLVVALSRSSCAPSLGGAPDAGEEGDESRGFHKGCQRAVCGVRLVRERGTYTASGDRLRASWSAADRFWLRVPPVSKRVSPRLPWPPARGAAESRDAPLRPCECELPRFTWHWADPYREEAVRAAREFLKLCDECGTNGRANRRSG